MFSSSIFLFIFVVFYTELNSPLSRILFKDSDLKKMERMDAFMKVLNMYALKRILLFILIRLNQSAYDNLQKRK